MMRVGIASDHGGFTLKGQVTESLCPASAGNGESVLPLR